MHINIRTDFSAGLRKPASVPRSATRVEVEIAVRREESVIRRTVLLKFLRRQRTSYILSI
jgi:hypothetical protein